MQRQLHTRVERTAKGIADSAGAEADVRIAIGYPITYNDPALTAHATPILERVLGADRVEAGLPVTGAEDFSFFQEHIPGLFLMLGINDPSVPRSERPSNHSPFFIAEDDALITGVRTLVGFALDYASVAGD